MNLNKWDLRFLQMAKMTTSWSKDPRTQVGAVIVRPDKTVAAVGFNGLPPGMNDDHVTDRTLKNQCVIHAEENAILSARDASLTGFTAYVWGLHPCAHCASVMAKKEICRVVCVTKAIAPDWEASIVTAKLVFTETHIELNSITMEQYEEFAK